MSDDDRELADHLNRAAEGSNWSLRWLQELRDALSDDALEMLTSLVQDTRP